MATRQRPAVPNTPTELIGPPPPGEPPEPPPERELWPWLLVLLLLVLAGLAAAWYAARDNGGSSSPPRTRLTTAAAAVAKPQPERRTTTPAVTQMTVPDLVGQQRDDAVRTLEAQGLKASLTEVPSDQETGLVVAQAPHGGTKVDEASAVALNVSKGPSKPAPVTVTVPDVVGQSKDSAKDAISAAGLETSTQHVPSTQPSDTVVSQSPGGGSSAHQGDHVLLNLSDGPPKAKGESKGKAKHGKSEQPAAAAAAVPSVPGEDEATARADLRSAGFSVSSVDQPTSDSSQNGTVVDQSPPAGSGADPKSTVTIYVGRYNGD
jgi:beta-lactam-binding protein with PASTA domain